MPISAERTPQAVASKSASSMQRTLAVGRVGARRVMEAAARFPWVERVVDLDLDREAQREGYDLLFHVRGVGLPARVEVKCDRHSTGNIYLETVSVVEVCRGAVHIEGRHGRIFASRTTRFGFHPQRSRDGCDRTCAGSGRRNRNRPPGSSPVPAA